MGSHKTYELMHGLIYVYYDGHLTHILTDSPELRGEIAAKGYVQHNKHERESTKPKPGGSYIMSDGSWSSVRR